MAQVWFSVASVFPGPRKGLEHSQCLIHVCQRSESEGLQNGKKVEERNPNKMMEYSSMRDWESKFN